MNNDANTKCVIMIHIKVNPAIDELVQASMRVKNSFEVGGRGVFDNLMIVMITVICITLNNSYNNTVRNNTVKAADKYNKKLLIINVN